MLLPCLLNTSWRFHSVVYQSIRSYYPHTEILPSTHCFDTQQTLTAPDLSPSNFSSLSLEILTVRILPFSAPRTVPWQDSQVRYRLLESLLWGYHLNLHLFGLKTLAQNGQRLTNRIKKRIGYKLNQHRRQFFSVI